MTEENEKQWIPRKYEIYAAIGVTIIGLLVLALILVVTPRLGIDLERMSVFLAYRALLPIALFPPAIPLAIFAESVIKQWKGRSFRWGNVLAGIGMSGIFFVVSFFLLTIFDLVFSWLNVIWQIPLAVTCTSIGLVVMGYMTRHKYFRKHLKA
jgi:hypothetical protein